MRIAVIAPPWLAVPPPAYGGTELVLDTLCRGLAAAGHAVLLYATGDSTCPVERAWTYEEHLGVPRISPASELHHVMDAYEAAARWGADVVHDHTISGPVWAQAHARTPVATTNHGPFAGELLGVYRRIAPHVPVIAISHHQASTADGVAVRAVIHHGVDTDQAPVGDGTGGYAAFLGRMNPDKGVHTAIHVARRAGVPLKIAAKMHEAAEREYFESCVRPLLGGDIEYLGEVGGRDKHELLGGAMCLLNPIAWPEPFGMVMIEALAAGTPVVGSPYGAAPEIVDDGTTGFLRTSADDLVAALGRVGSLDRAACRRAVERRFSMQRMADDHARLFRSLVESDRAGAAELDQLLEPGAGIAGGSELLGTGT